MSQSQIATSLIKETKEFFPAIRYKKIIQIPQQKQSSNIASGKQIPSTLINSKFLKTLFPTEKIVAKTCLTYRESGQKTPAYITKFEKDNKIHLYIKNEQADKLGYASLCRPQGGIFKKPIGKDYIYNSMELTALESRNQARKNSPYRGIGTELLKAAVKESKANGFGGKIHLMAYDAKPPTVFYYKNGLKFTNTEKDLLMQKYLNTPANLRGELPQELQSGLMYLPEENIEKLLAM